MKLVYVALDKSIVTFKELKRAVFRPALHTEQVIDEPRPRLYFNISVTFESCIYIQKWVDEVGRMYRNKKI